MRGLLGSAHRRANAASAGLCEFRERRSGFSDTTPLSRATLLGPVANTVTKLLI